MKAMRILSATALLGGLAFLAPVSGQPAPSVEAPPAEETGTLLEYHSDEDERMTVAVNIDGRGPYRFIVDTGAERTVISSELARALGLSSTGDVTLASVSHVSRVPSVQIGELGVGRRTLTGIRAPALAERNI